MKKYIFLLTISFVSLFATAQPAVNYYNSAEGKSEAALKTALHSIISSGYVDKGYSFLYTIYETSDRTTSGNVWDMYSTCTWSFGGGTCGSYKNVCDCYNREHTVPQSWFNSQTPMRSDAYHVYPTDGKVNGIRSNDPYGETNSGNVGGKGLGKSGSSSFPGFSGKVFEPVDEYKGDLARTYFYFATRYENIMTSIGGESFNKTKYPAFPQWTINLLLKWHRQDPVSQKEIDRNNAIAFYQKNRNPFIDYPELAEHIWGDKKTTPWSKTISTEPRIVQPATGSSIEFGLIPYRETSAIVIDVKGTNLAGNINMSISGANASEFSLAKSSLTQAEVTAGYKLTISCTPQALGNIAANLHFSGGGIEATSVSLKASVTDNFLALDASNIGSDRFTANWSESAGATGYLLDVYKYTTTGTVAEILLEEDFVNNTGEDAPDGWDKDGYIITSNGEIRMASNSRDGVLITPLLDLSDITILTINAKSYAAKDNSPIDILINGNLFETIITGADYQAYEIELPELDIDSQISFFVGKGKRVYINYIEIRTEGNISEKETISGYPKAVGNLLKYQVTGLTAEQSYYYTVTPQGNGALESNEVAVTTDAPTHTNSNRFVFPVVYQINGTLFVSGVAPGSKLTVYSSVGKKLIETHNASDQISVPINEKGIFIVRLQNETGESMSRKVVVY